MLFVDIIYHGSNIYLAWDIFMKSWLLQSTFIQYYTHTVTFFKKENRSITKT